MKDFSALIIAAGKSVSEANIQNSELKSSELKSRGFRNSKLQSSGLKSSEFKSLEFRNSKLQNSGLKSTQSSEIKSQEFQHSKILSSGNGRSKHENSIIQSPLNQISGSNHSEDQNPKDQNAEDPNSDLGIVRFKQEHFKREQVGFFHVWIRGSNRNNVFYDNTDFIGFLERCHKSAMKYKTIVTAFVIMDNHVHLQIYTYSLNAFMKSLLMSFNQWYNKRKGLTGQLFNSPFSSKLIDNEDYLLYNYLYILTNPVRAGICDNISKYRWSSYHFTKEENYNFLKKFINISDLVFNYFFKSNIELHYTANKHLTDYWSLLDEKNAIENEKKTIVNEKKTLERESESIKGVKRIETDNKTRVNNNNNNNREKRSHLVRPTDHEVATSLNFILRGRKLNELSNKELIMAIKILRDHGNATYRQISSVTHECLHEVMRILKA